MTSLEPAGSHGQQDAAEHALLAAALPRTPGCAAEARQLVRDAVGDSLSQPALDVIVLAVSELVGNAWKHGTGAIEFKAGYRAGTLRIEVIDEGRGVVPEISERRPGQTGGWGLRIIDEVAVKWGYLPGTTHVWADLPLV